MCRSAQYLTSGFLLWLCYSIVSALTGVADEPPKPLEFDPTEWGSDHIGQSFPDYMTGDECLFCHRSIGTGWGDNPHQLTIRPASPDDTAVEFLREQIPGNNIAAEAEYLLGSRRTVRFLKRPAEYGKLELLHTRFVPADIVHGDAGELIGIQSPVWDAQLFAENCAGCHTTAVDSQTKAFSAISLDCFSCHGNVDLEHTDDVSKVLLSRSNRVPRQIVSICGQCHLRGGKSKSTGLPYPNTFVAGDNLFRDFLVDWSDEAIGSQPPVDQHIWHIARDIAIHGRSEMDCLSCHEVHEKTTERHQLLDKATVCSTCHVEDVDGFSLRGALLPANRTKTHSHVCAY